VGRVGVGPSLSTSLCHGGPWPASVFVHRVPALRHSHRCPGLSVSAMTTAALLRAAFSGLFAPYWPYWRYDARGALVGPRTSTRFRSAVPRSRPQRSRLARYWSHDRRLRPRPHGSQGRRRHGGQREAHAVPGRHLGVPESARRSPRRPPWAPPTPRASRSASDPASRTPSTLGRGQALGTVDGRCRAPASSGSERGPSPEPRLGRRRSVGSQVGSQAGIDLPAQTDDGARASCGWAPSSAAQRSTRAPPPAASLSTSALVAMVVSPGVVIASAPWAAPYCTAVANGSPANRP
jgi:hypothetical protein